MKTNMREIFIVGNHVFSDYGDAVAAANEKNTNIKTFVVVEEVEERRHFDIEYQIEGDSRKRTGLSLGHDAHEAMQNFLADYSPSFCRISAIRVRRAPRKGQAAVGL